MLDQPIASAPLTDVQRQLLTKPPPCAPIFQLGDRLAAATPPPDAATQRIAVVGGVTIDYLRRAIACAVAAEGVFPVTYQATFGSYVQDILDPASALHAFAPDLVVIAPSHRDLIAPLPIAATA